MYLLSTCLMYSVIWVSIFFKSHFFRHKGFLSITACSVFHAYICIPWGFYVFSILHDFQYSFYICIQLISWTTNLLKLNNYWTTTETNCDNLNLLSLSLYVYFFKVFVWNRRYVISWLRVSFYKKSNIRKNLGKIHKAMNV